MSNSYKTKVPSEIEMTTLRFERTETEVFVVFYSREVDGDSYRLTFDGVENKYGGPAATEEQEAEMKQAWTDAHGGWRGGDEEV
jgi:hypothetical protein